MRTEMIVLSGTATGSQGYEESQKDGQPRL
jgi:hypothetical protein